MIKLSKSKFKKLISHLTCQYNISALPAIFICSLFMSEHVIGADDFRSSDWQCRSTANNKWDCSPALDNNIGLTDLNDDNSSINTNAALKNNIAVKPTPKVTFPEADFSNQKSGLTNSLEKQTTSTHQSPAMNPMWASCAVQMNDAQYSQSPTPSTDQADSDETNIEADSAESPDSSQINFAGNVVITQKEQKLIADKVNYNKTSRIFDAQGNVTITDPDLILKGDTARYQADDKKGRIENASYQLPSRSAQGVASSMQFKPGEISSEELTYSTCPAGDQDWVLSASSMDFYTDKGYGEGSHAVMKFKGIPIAYTPYIRFPLNNERQSGFLMPSFGSTDNSGFEVTTPYYFNIAPNQDATVTPKYFSDRG
ncbi:MAG: LPS-assembly protein LptD, partial [Proteobacteria bacterium]|nr:LPS-assembly protein LptD [Pseudomonadota bacterium]